MSASKQVANGPESTCSNARIFIPSNAREGFELFATLTSSTDFDDLNGLNCLNDLNET